MIHPSSVLKNLQSVFNFCSFVLVSGRLGDADLPSCPAPFHLVFAFCVAFAFDFGTSLHVATRARHSAAKHESSNMARSAGGEPTRRLTFFAELFKRDVRRNHIDKRSTKFSLEAMQCVFGIIMNRRQQTAWFLRPARIEGMKLAYKAPRYH